MNVEDCRHFYAEEVRIAANLPSGPLIDAFATVPRELYLGGPPWKICSAEHTVMAAYGVTSDPYVATSNPCDLYHNVLAAIVPERHLNNGHPSTLALWISALDLKAGDCVYHAGCGVGYYTAIMAEVVGPSGAIVAIDLDEDLVKRAAINLSEYPRVQPMAGDAATFDPGACDAILINAGITHPAPLWLDRLAEGGRLVMPLTGRTGSGIMLGITKAGHDYVARIVSFVSIYSSPTLRDAEIEPLIASAMSKRSIFNVKRLRLDPHEANKSCLLHTSRMCLSSG